MRPLAPLAVVVAAVVAVTGAGAACGSDEKPQTVVALAGQTVAITRLQSVAGGLCEAARQVTTDTDGARQTFFGQSHEGLHLIARGLEETDRAASARLLEAKQRVEADFSAPPPGPQVAADLRQLAEITRSSLDRFDVEVAACSPA